MIPSSHKLDQNILTFLTIGDWSNDGHNMSDKIYYHVNYPVEDIRQAYKDSCRKTGVQFNHNANYTGVGSPNCYDQILTEYSNNSIRPHENKILREHNVITDTWLSERKLEETEDHYICMTEPKDVADLIMRFISISMPKDFTYTETTVNATPINGWWNDQLNCQFGYGIYYD